MEKEFVPYNLSLRMKQLGFDEPCFGAYGSLNNYELHLFSQPKFNDYGSGNSCVAPLFQQAFRWFREKYHLFRQVNIHTYFIYNISNGDFKMVKEYDKLFDTYEEAELACLEKLIEIVEQKQKEL